MPPGGPQPLAVPMKIALGAHAADPWVRLGHFNEPVQHVRLDLDIVVEEQNVVVAVLEDPPGPDSVPRRAATVTSTRICRRSGQATARASGAPSVEALSSTTRSKLG
jgi:hypothetical protein